MWRKVVKSGKKWSAGASARRFAYIRKVERMFLGHYEHTIDEKGRTTVPVRYRALLEEGAFITQGFEQNLIVLPTSAFDKIYQTLNQMSITDPNARQLRRLILAHADRIEFDRAGRILIPQFLRETANLQSEVIVVGMGGYFELWSPERWQAQNEKLQDPELTAQRFATLDLSVI
jgi:MraZ protein